jgi:putative membrane protein
MISVTDLPAVNATLNGIATLFLVAGWISIRRNAVDRHRACMIAALACSALFLTSYLVYHYHAGSRPFTGTGAIRTFYFTILITHVILAMAIVPMVLLTVVHAWRERFARHRAIARWTLPLWLYVSVTGVVVYLMLYQM